jgi:hypothetical protein
MALTDEQLAGMRRKYEEFRASLAQDIEDGLGDRERVNLYQLNLAAYMGEVYVGRLLVEVDRLRGALAEAEARATGAVQDLEHLAHLVHRSHHNEQEGTYETCTRPTCADLRRAIARGKGA